MAARNYSRAEMQAMQQDAVKRVREMQARSQNFINGNGMEQYCPEPPPPPPPKKEPPPPPPPPPQNNFCPKNIQGNGSFLSGLIPDIKIDEEKALIIFILIILARNGADMKILLALGYLLM